MTIPINANTFKKSFLSGDGEFEVKTDNDAWKTLIDGDKPFNENVDTLAELNIKASKDFTFGDSSDSSKFALSVSAKAEANSYIKLIWANPDETIKKYKLEQYLTNNKLYMAVKFGAKASAEAEARFPVGPMTGRFGIDGGGYFNYMRIVPYQKTKSVKSILADLFAETRLPQKVDKVSEIPAEGELLLLEYGGYLNLSAGLMWGYELAGTRSFGLKDLDLEAKYAFRANASASIEYKIAGDFSIEVRRGSQDDWVRFVVRKRKRQNLNFLADIKIGAEYELNGIPDSADDFLEGLFGTNAKLFLSYLSKAQKYSDLDELEKTVGALGKQYLQKLSDDLIGKVLSNSTLKEFLAEVKKLTDAYNNFDNKIVNLYESKINDIKGLNKILDKIIELETFEGLKSITNTETWDVIRELGGDDFYKVLSNNSDFGKFLDMVKKTKSFINEDATKHIREIIKELKEKFPLDSMIEELSKYDTPEELKKLADEKLQGLVEKIIGKAFKDLKSIDEFKEALKAVNKTLSKIETLKGLWEKNIKKATEQSIKLDVQYAYKYATESDALLDVELNLANKDGVMLAEQASNGNFAEVIRKYDPLFIKINPDSKFLQKRTQSQNLKVNILGFGYERLVELFQEVEHSFITEKGGLVHVFTMNTYLKQIKKYKRPNKVLEEMQSNFLFQVIGESLQPTGDGNSVYDGDTNKYVLQTLKDMTASYTVTISDDYTKPNELTQYLKLAKYLGFIDIEPYEYVAQLNNQFPNGFGKVSVEYFIKFDELTVKNAFLLSGDELKNKTRQTVREVIGARYLGMKGTDHNARIGFAYLSSSYAKLHDENPMLIINQSANVDIPAWFTGKTNSTETKLYPEDRRRIATLYSLEKNFANKFEKLDELIDKVTKKKQSIPVNKLADASRDFIGFADDIDAWGGENAFFITFDKLTQLGSQGKWGNSSWMLLTITPDDKTESITQYMSGD